MHQKLMQRVQTVLIDWLIDFLLFNVLLKNFSLIWRRLQTFLSWRTKHINDIGDVRQTAYFKEHRR
jgi:hypothetical protein